MSFTALINANVSGFSQGVERAIRDIERLERTVSERLDKVGDQFVSIGKKATVLSAGIAALTVGAAKSAIDFESAFAGVQKTVDATEEGYAALSRGIRQLAKEIPATTTEISAVAEAAGQLGIQTENVLSFTRTMIDLGEATNLSSDQAATSFARLANIMQTNQENFGRLGSTVVDLGNNFATTESEITEMALRLAGAGKQAGLSEANVLSLAASLSSVGINAEAGGSAFSKVLMDMQLASEVGGESLEGFAQVAGMSADQFAKSFKDDAAGALLSFIQGLQNTEKTGVSAIQILDELGITEIRMRDALLRSAGAGDTMREAIELGNKAWEENTALTEEAAKRYATTASQLKILGNYVADLGIQFGELLLPVINSAVSALKSFTEWLANLSPGMQETILILAGVAAAFGPVMLGIGGVLKLLPLLKAGFMAATGPIGLIVAAVAGAAVLIIKHWDEIKAYFTTGGGAGIFDTVMETVSMLKGFFSKVFEDIKTAVLYIWDTMGGDLMRIINNTISSIVIVIETIIKTFRNVVKIVTSIFKGDFKGALDGLKNLFRDIFTGIGQLVGAALSNIASGVAGFFRLIGLDGLADSISTFAEKLSPPVIEFGNTVDDTTEKVEDLTEAIDAIPPNKEITIVANITSGAIDLGEVANPVGGLLGNVGQEFDSMIEDITTRAAASMDALQATLGEKLNGIKESVGIGMADVSNLLAQGVAGFAESIGTAFATGDWDNMGSELIKAVGGLAMQFGATLISMGFAALALKKLIMNPYTAIAAGVALVALGAAATAAASKQVSAATGGGSGGGGGGSTGYRDTASPGQSEYRGAWQDDFKVEFVQKGSDLVGVLDVAEQRKRRS